jgi:hypothetical protein
LNDRRRGKQSLKPALNWAAAAVAGIVLVVIGFVIATVWTSMGDSEISAAGWLAMGLGIVVTLGLGVGLMALVFFSNRRGYDEIGRRDE